MRARKQKGGPVPGKGARKKPKLPADQRNSEKKMQVEKQMEPRVKIIYASYGARGCKHVDVTPNVLKIVAADLHGRLSLRDMPPKSLGPDPRPGTPKQLCITYADSNNCAKQQEVGECDCQWVDVPTTGELFGPWNSHATEESKRVSEAPSASLSSRGVSRERKRGPKKNAHPLNVAFQKVFVINLARATERRRKITETFRAEGLDFEFVEGIDGHRAKIAYRANPKHGQYWNAGAAAIVNTTVQILQKTLLDERIEQIVIFEDDVYFEPNAKSVLEEALPALLSSVSWELFYLGHGYIGPPPVQHPEHKSIKRMQRGGGLGCYGYCIHRSVMHHLISKLTDARDPLDVIYADEVFNRNKSYAVSPLVVRPILDAPSCILNPDAQT